jgi:nicotinic acid mononucleotide adenylyltransferase
MSLPKLYFSYQGAFGPPTFGHYSAMKAFTDEILKQYDGLYDIHMMFMPTAASGSKPHLEPSQEDRLNILNIFCDKLKAEFTSPNINFHASNLEFELRKAGNMNSSTIFTIEALAESLNYKDGDILILGMGKDNMLQLPYWLRVNEYVTYVKSIYIVDRELSVEEMKNIAKFKVLGQMTDQEFEKILPWSIDAFIINERFNIKDGLKEGKYEKGTDVTQIEIDYKNQLNIELPNIFTLNKKIPATSSSMLRYFIGQYLENNNNENLVRIKNLIFGTKEITLEEENVVKNTIELYKKIFNGNYPVDKNYLSVYNSLVFQKGGKRTYKGKRKSYRKRNTKKKCNKKKNPKNKLSKRNIKF